MDFEREKTFDAGAADVGAEGPEGVDETLHGAFAHLGDAVDAVDAARGGGAEGGEKTGGGAGEADVESDGFVFREAVGLFGDLDGASVGVGVDCEAESLEGFDHQVGVFAEEGAGERDLFLAQGGEEQGAVGEAFRAGQRDFTAHGAGEGLDREDGGKRRHGRAES